MTAPGRDDVQARAAALLADKYADPWLKLARYEVLTDDLLARLDEAVNYLQRVVQADRDDAKMGYPIPGDSCLAACIGLEVMRFLDEIGALTERPVADANGSTSGGIPAQVGTDRSVSAPDIDALKARLYAALEHNRGCSCGGCSGGKNAVDALVAIAKDTAERAERAERADAVMRDSWLAAEARADALGCRLVEMEKYADLYEAEYAAREAAEARVAALEETLVETNLRVGTVLMALGFIKRGRTGFHAICERELTEADEIARAALASHDPKEGTA